MIKKIATHKPAVYKKELLAPGLFCQLRLTDQSIYADKICTFLNTYQLIVVILSKKSYYPLTKITWLKVKDHHTIIFKGKSYLGIRHCNPDKLIDDMACFHRI